MQLLKTIYKYNNNKKNIKSKILMMNKNNKIII